MQKLLVLFFVLCSYFLYAEVIPFSKTKVKNPQKIYDEYFRISPDDQQKEALNTKAWLWYDEKNLYVRWESELNENFERGEIAIDDQIPSADYVRLQLVTQLDEYYAYVFYAFPRGNRADGIRNANMGIDFNWDCSYTYKNKFENNTWYCEMKIPFKDLRFIGEGPYNWKVLFTRYEDVNESYYSAPYVKTAWRKDYFRKAYPIRLAHKIQKSLHMKARASVVTNHDFLEEKTTLDSENIGFDFEFNPSSSFKTKLTIQPDFSEVPLDEAQDIYNEEYEPQFQENRYFFTEDLDVFGVGQDLFYTRYIVKPKIAFKMTGNTEAITYGTLFAHDESRNIPFYYDNQENLLHKVDTNSYFYASAIKLKGEQHRTQFTFLNRKNDLFDNQVLFVNPSYDITNNINMYANMTSSRMKEKRYYSPTNYSVQKNQGYSTVGGLEIRTPFSNFNLNYEYTSDDFFVKTGRVFENGFENYHFNTWMDNQPQDRILSNYSFSTWLNYSEFTDDTFRSFNFGVNPWVEFYSKIGVWFNYNYEAQKEMYFETPKTFNLNQYGIGTNLDFCKEFELELSYNYNKNIHYSMEDDFWKKVYGIEFYGHFLSMFSYWIDYTYVDWKTLPKATEYDNKYAIINGNFTITLASNLKISNGLRYADYETTENEDEVNELIYSGDKNIFSNLIWEYKPNSKVVFGYNYASDKINNKNKENIHSIYLKLTYMLG